VYLSDVIFEGNTGQEGGGIYANFSSAGGSIEMHNVILRSNTAMAGGVGQGGGAYVHLPASTSQFLMQDSQVYGNTVDGTGGGIFNLQTSPNASYTDFCHIEASTLSGNFGLYGGAIYHDGFITANSLLHIINSTLSGNAVGKNGYGGGIYIYAGQIQLINSTV